MLRICSDLKKKLQKPLFIAVFLLQKNILPRPSANPNTILHITRAVMLPAKNGVMNVAILHKSTLHISTFLAPNFEAHKPPGKSHH